MNEQLTLTDLHELAVASRDAAQALIVAISSYESQLRKAELEQLRAVLKEKEANKNA